MRIDLGVHLKAEKSVLFLITGLGHGGAETQVVRVACELKKRGWEVSVVTLIKPVAKPLIQQLSANNVMLKSLELGEGSKLRDLRLINRLLRILESEKPYVLCSFLFHANIIGQVTAQLSGVPRFITSIRGASFGSDKRIKFAKFFHSFDHITTLNSNEVAEKMIKEGVLKREKTRVVNNAISIQKYRRPNAVRGNERKKLGIAPDTFVFIAVGRVHPVKGYDFLVDACAGLKGKIKLLIVGKDDNSALYDNIKKSKLENFITLLGYRVDIPELLAAADALVLSSVSEGLPNALIEAHAAGLPVISTRVGGASEIVIENESGYLVEPQNANALSKAMQKMAQIPKIELKKMGDIGQKHVANTFGLAPIVDQWEEVLLGQNE